MLAPLSARLRPFNPTVPAILIALSNSSNVRFHLTKVFVIALPPPPPPPPVLDARPAPILLILLSSLSTELSTLLSCALALAAPSTSICSSIFASGMGYSKITWATTVFYVFCAFCCSSRSLETTLAQARRINHSSSLQSRSLTGSVPNSSPNRAAETIRGSFTNSPKTPS